MSSVDERIVNMKIENKQFLSGAKASRDALDNLNKTVNAVGNTKGMQSLGGAVDTVKQKFSLLNAAAVTAVATITNKLVNAGISMVKGFTLDPIIAGFHSYEQTINATKTIMSNTGASAKTTGKYLKDLQVYANQTVYSFSDMAKNIGTFTAAGVKLPAATQAIKGIANLAALSGSNTQQASSAMYQLSQALAAGQVHLQDWNSVVNAGMGGKVFQTALARTAVAMGELDKSQVQYGKDAKLSAVRGESFRESIQSKPGHNSWLTSGVLTKTLEQFTGEMTKAQLVSEGFTAAQAKQILKMGETARHSATDIKTYSQLTEALKEEVATAWGMVFKEIFGGIGAATKMFSAIHVVAENALTGPVYMLAGMLKGWVKLGGRTAAMKGFANIWKSISMIFSAVGQAWREMFPPSTGKTLADLSKGFQALTEHLIPSKSALVDIKDIFKAVFTVFGIGATVVKNIFKYFFSLISLFTNNGGGAANGLLAMVGGVARLITGFTQMTDLSGKIDDFFNRIIAGRARILEPIIKTVGAIVNAFVPLFHGDFSGFTTQFKAALSNLQPLGSVISAIGDKISSVLKQIQSGSSGVIGQIAGFFSQGADAVKRFGDNLSHAFDSFKGGSANAATKSAFVLTAATTDLSDGGNKLVDILKAIGSWIKAAASDIGSGISIIWSSIKGWVGGLDKIDLITNFSYILNGAILVMVYKFIKTLKGYFDGFKEIGESISGSFNQLTDTLKTMQQGVRAKIILNIAIAVGILAASIWTLSRIPAKQLAISMGAITILLGEVVGIMALLGKGKLGDFAKKNLLVLAASLSMIAFAMLELAGAVAIFGNMDIKTLAKGLGSIAITLGLLVAASFGLSKAEGPVLRASAALVVMSFALQSMAAAILVYNAIDAGTFAAGLVKMGVALGIIVVAMNAMPTDKLLGNSVGMVAIAGSMVILAGALKMLGGMSVVEIAKGLITMSLALGILAGALEAMQTSFAGSMALVAVASSIVILANALQIMGNMSIGEIAKSMLALAGALTIFLIAGAAAEVVGAGLLMLGGAIALIGVGMLAAGVGIAAFAAGLGVLVGLGTAAFGVITVAIQAFLAMLPSIAVEVAAAFVAFLGAMAAAAPKVADSFVQIVGSMIDAGRRLLPKLVGLINDFIGQMVGIVRKNAPKFGAMMSTLLNTGLTVLERGIPRMANAGLRIIQGVLHAVAAHVGEIATSAIRIVTNFIDAISRNIGRVINSGVKLVLSFVNGVAGAIRAHSTEMGQAGANLASALVSGLVNGLGAAAQTLVNNAAAALVSHMPGWMKKVLGIHSPSRVTHEIGVNVAQGLANGLLDSRKMVKDATNKLAKHVKDTAESHKKKLPKNTYALGVDVGQGLANGILASIKTVLKAATTMAKDAIDTISTTASKGQLRADMYSANANAQKKVAAELRHQASHNKKLTKAQKKDLNQRASALEKAAKKNQHLSDVAQGGVDAANKRAQARRDFAAADNQGKADILNTRSESAAKNAEADRKRAMQLAAQADLIRKKDAKRAAALDKQAKAALADAKQAANAAKSNALLAQTYVVKSIVASAADVTKQIQADRAAVAEQLKLSQMTDQQKEDYFKAQAAAAQATSDSKYALAEQLLAKAKAEAKTNAAQAKQDVADAQQAVTDAEAAKQSADDYTSQAQQLADQLAQGTDGSGSTSSDPTHVQMPSVTIDSAMVFGAQNMFDAYAKALVATTDAASKDNAPTIQFVQNNTSPVALSPAEIYRQSKNILSDAERKLTGALS